MTNKGAEEQLQRANGSEPAEKETSEYAIIISGVREGTTAVDMRTILEDFGRVSYCKEIRLNDIPEDTLAFEAGFRASQGALKAVSELDGIIADGCKLKASLLTPKIKQEEQEGAYVQPQSTGLKLKGFATASNNPDDSLLSRLGGPVLHGTVAFDAKSKPNGALPSEPLRPYEDLLLRAGVDSIDRLKQLVRPGTIKEYIEMLCREYPDEQLLQGLTARWALKERLEDWLGQKEPLKLEWDAARKA